MATEDPRKAAMDAALYLLGKCETPYSTPFTWGNGLTVLQILERIRRAVVDTINYAEGFGKEVDVKVEQINKAFDAFIRDSKKKIDDYEEYITEKTDITNALIEDFKKRLISAEFIDKGDWIEAPLMGGGKIEVFTRAGYDNLKKAVDDKNAEQDRYILDRYSKAESDDRYVEDAKLTHGVVIGSSNATTEASRWTHQLCIDLGLTPHVYAIGGGGFTSDLRSNFATQLDNAIAGMTEWDRLHTKYFFVIDLLNDIRAQNSVKAQLPSFFRKAQTNFPNSQIVILPVTLNESTLNEAVQIARSATARTNELIEGASPYRALIAEGSVGWMHEGATGAAVWDEANNGVHFTQAGYDRIRCLFESFIKGNDSWVNYGWAPLYTYMARDSGILKDYNYLNMKRDRSQVYIAGSFKVGSAPTTLDQVFFSIPAWARPYDGVQIPCRGNDRTTKYIYITKTAEMASSDVLSANETYHVDFSYTIW